MGFPPWASLLMPPPNHKPAPMPVRFSVLMILIGIFFTFPSDSSLDAEDWNRFRGPNGSGVQNATLPTTWSESENLAWRVKLPGKGSSSPIVWNDRVYLTAFSGYAMDYENPGDRDSLQLHVLCLKVADGSLIWDCPITPSSEEQSVSKRVAEHGYASPTPCADAFAVYASFGPSGVVAVSHEGELIWRRSVGTNTVGFGAAASPIVHEDIVIQNASIESGTLFALDKRTGDVRWTTEGIQKAWTTPTVAKLANGDAELIVNQKTAILGIDLSNGKQLWSCEAIQDYIVPCVVQRDGLLYCSGGRENKTFVVRPGGRGDVSASHLIWDSSRGANVTSPVLVGDHLFWSHDKSIALCLRASDGEEMFRERMPTRARIYASIVSDGKHLFLTTRDKGVLVLEASPKYKEIAINKLGGEDERFNATPAIYNNSLILRSDTHLYRVSEQ